MKQDRIRENEARQLPERSYKGLYGFRLGTTSFIYRADYRTNVARLGRYLDEIELLFFEMPPGGMPEAGLVEDLAGLAARLGITYNIHLPLDLELAAADKARRRHQAGLTARLISSTRSLPVTSYTIHVNYPRQAGRTPPDGAIGTWRRRAAGSLSRIIETAPVPPSLLSVENLEYPFRWIAPVIEELDLAVCLDIGHLVSCGHDLEAALEDFGNRAAVIHLYGTCRDKDHGALSLMAPEVLEQVANFLPAFSGSLMLEVFSPEDLRASLATLTQMLS